MSSCLPPCYPLPALPPNLPLSPAVCRPGIAVCSPGSGIMPPHTISEVFLPRAQHSCRSLVSNRFAVSRFTALHLRCRLINNRGVHHGAVFQLPWRQRQIPCFDFRGCFSSGFGFSLAASAASADVFLSFWLSFTVSGFRTCARSAAISFSLPVHRSSSPASERPWQLSLDAGRGSLLLPYRFLLFGSDYRIDIIIPASSQTRCRPELASADLIYRSAAL